MTSKSTVVGNVCMYFMINGHYDVMIAHNPWLKCDWLIKAHWFLWNWQGRFCFCFILATVFDEVRLGQVLRENHTRLLKHPKTRQAQITHGHPVKTNTSQCQQGYCIDPTNPHNHWLYCTFVVQFHSSSWNS